MKIARSSKLIVTSDRLVSVRGHTGAICTISILFPFLVPLILASHLLSAVSATGAESKGKKIEQMIGTASGQHSTREELVSVRETARFEIEADLLTVLRSGRERKIVTNSEDILITDKTEIYRVRLSARFSKITVQQRWQSLFKSTYTGFGTSSVEIFCKDGPCIESIMTRTMRCLAGCDLTEVNPETREWKSAIQIPLTNLQDAKLIASRLSTLIEFDSSSPTKDDRER